MKELGCYYLHIYYPSHIYLKEKTTFSFEFENNSYHVLILKKLKSVIINDFDNKIIGTIDDNGLNHHSLERKNIDIREKSIVVRLDDGSVAYAIDYAKNNYTEYYTKDYTELILYFESNNEVDNLSIGQKVLDFFINSYRTISGDVLTLEISKTTYVSTVIKEYFYTYNDEDLKKSKEERNKVNRSFKLALKHCTLPFWNTQGKRLQADVITLTDELVDFFSKKKRPTALQEFLLKAKEELEVHKNFKYSFIETWTSLEVAIVTYLRNAKLAKGISKNKIDDFETEVGISYLLNIELPLIHHNTNAEYFKELVGKVDSIRKLRNKLIHQNKEISASEAENAYKIALVFLNYLGILKVKNL